ncbi:unnamed protein product [Boreogadus saida]
MSLEGCDGGVRGDRGGGPPGRLAYPATYVLTSPCEPKTLASEAFRRCLEMSGEPPQAFNAQYRDGPSGSRHLATAGSNPEPFSWPLNPVAQRAAGGGAHDNDCCSLSAERVSPCFPGDKVQPQKISTRNQSSSSDGPQERSREVTDERLCC